MKKALLLVAFASWAALVIAQSPPQRYTAAWTSATTAGASGAAVVVQTQGSPIALTTVAPGSSAGAGEITLEVSDTLDASVTDNWWSVACPAPTSSVPSPRVDIVASSNVAAVCNVVGWQRFRARLSVAISGPTTAAGTVNVGVQLANGTAPLTKLN